MQKDATKKTKWAHSFIAFSVALIAFIFIATSSHFRKHYITINQTTIEAAFARTQTEKAKGLCCRDSLSANSGMLFVYDSQGLYRFWMKDTRIPLDMYWINSEKKIVHIEHSVKPESFPKTYGPPKLAQYILETNAGFAKQNNINVGDSVDF